MRTLGNRYWCGVTALLMAGAFVSIATADLSDVVFRIEATNAAGTAVYSASVHDGYWRSLPQYVDKPNVGGGYDWKSGLIELRDPVSHAVIAKLNSASLGIASDPQINMEFAVQAGEFGPTDFTITSALLSFPTLHNARALASAQFQIVDTDGDTASLAPIGAGAYRTQYNGFFPGGSTFAEFIGAFQTNEWEGASQALNVPLAGYLPIAGAVSDMCARVKFTLSANDLASGTTNYEITPEPSAFLLLIVGLAVARRR